ncbi:hypothetical protein Rsub_01543 [Raphidocelis subcapitata]|uniref:BBSome complex member BBS5 PH domain-containing protein n=1 Tax=Raphidocelis subcapitata TaxID=307507 RepID=A0A2V0NMD1_9CHLO|nr:hypothetical protein Rsub_01543 [Raphidocelis subcapitata]|eukprot:GBF88644.1 hypothetical protein Rsub_01543 [Raphidocelis subcapitata]
MEALFGARRGPEAPDVWQDREIRFDAPAGDLACRRGEVVLDYMEGVEDTKGNNGERGELTVTNLRIVWVCAAARRTNISIGLDCLSQIAVRPAASRLRGSVSALYLLTRHGSQRYEFVFTALAPGSGGPELLAVVQGVSQAYEASRLYRELKLRGAVVSEGDLRLLPNEQAFSKVSGVWNLSGDQGNLGALYITSVRLVWCSAASDAFSISLPFMQIKHVRLADSKFGPCLVVETMPRAGSYVYSQSPVFGVEYDPGIVRREAAAAERDAAAAKAHAEEDVTILDAAGAAGADAWAAACYCASADAAAAGGGGGCGADARGPVFSPELGLAVEPPRDAGTTLRALWSVL